MAPRPAGGPLESLSRWWNERLERLLAPAGCRALGRDEGERRGDQRRPRPRARASSSATCASRAVAERAPAAPAPRRPLGGRDRACLPRRSPRGAGMGVRDRDASWRPAIRVDRFARARAAVDSQAQAREALPAVPAHRLRRAAGPHHARRSWATARSLLYLVSRSFEGGARGPDPRHGEALPRGARAAALGEGLHRALGRTTAAPPTAASTTTVPRSPVSSTDLSS